MRELRNNLVNYTNENTLIYRTYDTAERLIEKCR